MQLKLSAYLIVILLILNIAAKAMGSLQQQPDLSLEGFFVQGCKDKSYPCWYGIAPGVTTWDAAETTLKNMGYRPYYDWWSDVGRFTFWASPNQMYLVDVEAFSTSNFDNVETVQLIPNCRFEAWLLFPDFGYYVMDNAGIKRLPVSEMHGRTALSTTKERCSALWAELEVKW
jgi:hypothetical protein